jgi:hypothetical protein
MGTARNLRLSVGLKAINNIYCLHSGLSTLNNNNNKPVSIGETGTFSRSLRQYLKNIPEKHEIKKLQNAAILGTAHTMQDALM